MAEMKIADNMTFEQAVKELNEIIVKLNDGKVTLDESLELYKYANKLVKFCNDKLNEVKQQIEEVNTNDGSRTEASV